MNVPITFAALTVLTGALVLLRFLWPRLASRTKSILLVCACVIPTLFAMAQAAHWSTSSLRLNTAFYWAFIACYEFWLILFTRLRPRWLTSIIATVLILPLLSASVFLPLAGIFDTAPVTTVDLGDHFISERVPWGSRRFEMTGTDLAVYSSPFWTSFVRRRRQEARYYNSQCDASKAFAVLQPDRKSVLMVCPASPDQPPESARHLVVELH